MARYNPHHDAGPVHDAAARWRDACLLRDESILSPAEMVWTSDNLHRLRRAFTDNPDESADSFLAKLERQLAEEPDLVKQLAAELLWAMLLFPSNIGPERKREIVEAILGWRASPMPTASRFLDDEVLGGLGSAGTAYNTHRPLEFAYAIDLALHLKRLPAQERQRVLSEPWAFSEFLSEVPVTGTRQLSHILEHLLFPDTFERVSSGADKRRIIVALGTDKAAVVKEMDRAGRDRRLLDIRRTLASRRGDQNFDFYEEEFARKWRAGDHAATDDETITEANIRLLASARRRARYGDLEPAELANYRHLHGVLARLGQIVMERLGGPEFYELKLTSGFHLASGVRGAIPKDLWFGVSRRENRESLMGNPQLFMIVSTRGLEYGFAASTHASDFTNVQIKARVQEALPKIYDLLPNPGSIEAHGVEHAMSGTWFYRRKNRLEARRSEFSDFGAWLEHFKSGAGRAQGGGSLVRYLSGEALDASDLVAEVEEMVDTFRPLMERLKISGPDPKLAPASALAKTERLAALFSRAVEQFREARQTSYRQVPELWASMNAIQAALEARPGVRQRPIVVKWSLGKGVWANVPWIALLNSNVTTSTQRGIYIVLLIAEDLSAIYLTLNQGVTDLVNELGQKAASRLLLERSEAYQQQVQSLQDHGFTLGNSVDFKPQGWRSKNYETGTIAYVRYASDVLPADEVIDNHLDKLLQAYDHLVDAAEDEAGDVLPTPEHHAGPVEVEAEPYSLDDALSGLFMSREELARILAIWRAKKNLILQGPPGVGKSFVAKRLAFALIEQHAPSRVQTVQFHQSYSYEDFVQGYRPTENGGFTLKDGVFLRFCNAARKDPEHPYVLIIDEINRGNLSKIFGELMLLMEADKRKPSWATDLAYSRGSDPKFYVPDNLYLLGLMNTADRSLSMVDYALRRRFAFVTLSPQFASPGFRDYLLSTGAPGELADRIVTRMTELNRTISADTTSLGPGFQIGHSFFISADGAEYSDGWYERIVETEIRPLLEEYWFDDLDKAATWCSRLFVPAP